MICSYNIYVIYIYQGVWKRHKVWWGSTQAQIQQSPESGRCTQEEQKGQMEKVANEQWCEE